MAVQVQMKGIKRVSRIVTQLEPKLIKEIMKVSNTFMKDVQRSARARAPKFTGALAKSIHVKTGKKHVTLVVDSPYGRFQEVGFRPHWVQLFRSTRAGGTVADWAAAKGIQPWKNSIFVSKYKPFVRPAFEFHITKLIGKLSEGSKRAIAKAGGGI